MTGTYYAAVTGPGTPGDGPRDWCVRKYSEDGSGDQDRLVLAGVNQFQARRIACMLTCDPAEDPVKYTWPEGEAGRYLHQLHCRPDRCCYGCGCPCHRIIRQPAAAAPRLVSALPWGRWRRRHP